MSPSEEREIERIRAEYDRRDRAGLSGIYSYSNPAFVFHMQERERAILSFLEFEKVRLDGASVLEVGCGTGHILQRFLEFGAGEAMGIDLMELRIRKGKKSYPSLGLVQGNGARLPCKSGRFDLVMQFMCLSSVLDTTVREKIAEEMWRVLRPGGILLSYDLRPSPSLARLFRLPYYAVRKVLRALKTWTGPLPPKREALPHPTPTRPLSIQEIRALFSDGEMRYRPVSLDFNLSCVARRSFLLATLLSYVKPLRTHYLVLIRKPS